MKKKSTIELKKSEVIHILNLIENNKDDGTYYGPAFQYWARSRNIEGRLKQLKNSM